MNNEIEQKAPPENAEAVTDLTEAPSVNTEDIVDLSEVTAESEAVTAAADEGKTETPSEADSAPEKEDEKLPEESSAASPEAIKKYRPDIMRKTAVWVAAIAVFLSVFIITGYYVTTASKTEFHADCTDTIMW